MKRFYLIAATVLACTLNFQTYAKSEFLDPEEVLQLFHKSLQMQEELNNEISPEKKQQLAKELMRIALQINNVLNQCKAIQKSLDEQCYVEDPQLYNEMAVIQFQNNTSDESKIIFRKAVQKRKRFFEQPLKKALPPTLGRLIPDADIRANEYCESCGKLQKNIMEEVQRVQQELLAQEEQTTAKK